MEVAPGRRDPMERARGKKDGVPVSASFLVRVRREESLRIFVRNLQTGEEKYLSDPASLGPHLMRQLGEASTALDAPGRGERSA